MRRFASQLPRVAPRSGACFYIGLRASARARLLVLKSFARCDEEISFPGSAWERTVREAPPRLDMHDAIAITMHALRGGASRQCVPRQSLGTRRLFLSAGDARNPKGQAAEEQPPRSQALPGNALSARLCLANARWCCDRACHAEARRSLAAVRSQAEPGNEIFRRVAQRISELVA